MDLAGAENVPYPNADPMQDPHPNHHNMDHHAEETSPPLPSRRPNISPPSRGWTGRLVAGGILLGVIIAAIIARPTSWTLFDRSDGEDYSHLVTDVARRGPLLVTVNVQGNLDSQQNVTVSSNVEGSTTIISIVPEGTWVEKGDVVCVLDSSLMADDAAQQEIVVTNAVAAEVAAEQDVKVHRFTS